MTTTLDRDGVVAPARPTVLTRVGQGILVVLCAMCAVIGLSTMFVDDPFPAEATTMIASFGVLAGALGIGAVLASPRSLAARLSLCALPLFFVWHVAALGTWLPDAVLGVVSAAAVALVLLGARRRAAAV